MSTEDKGQVSEIEVDLAVPANGTETQPPAQTEQVQQPADQDEDGEGHQAEGVETDEDKSARAERRRRTRERNRLREQERDELIARQGAALEAMYEQLQVLGAHAQGGQLQRAEADHVAAKAELARAYESGNPQAVADATEALTIARLNVDALKVRRPAQQPPRRQPQGGGEAQVDPYAQAWLAKNATWYHDPSRRADAAFAHALSEQLVEEGFTPDELYPELDKRLKSRGIAVTAGPGREQPKVIVASGQRQALGPGKTKVTLNSRVQEHAERFGLNLKDPAVAKRIAQRFAAQQSK